MYAHTLDNTKINKRELKTEEEEKMKDLDTRTSASCSVTKRSNSVFCADRMPSNRAANGDLPRDIKV